MGKRATNKQQIKEIGARLSWTRIRLDLGGPSAVADRAEIKRNTYSQWETGKYRPDVDEAIRLCETFGYTLDWIYRGNPAGLPLNLAQQLGVMGAGELPVKKAFKAS